VQELAIRAAPQTPTHRLAPPRRKAGAVSTGLPKPERYDQPAVAVRRNLVNSDGVVGKSGRPSIPGAVDGHQPLSPGLPLEQMLLDRGYLRSSAEFHSAVHRVRPERAHTTPSPSRWRHGAVPSRAQARTTRAPEETDAKPTWVACPPTSAVQLSMYPEWAELTRRGMAAPEATPPLYAGVGRGPPEPEGEESPRLTWIVQCGPRSARTLRKEP
jgi:hypothetical protein